MSRLNTAGESVTLRRAQPEMTKDGNVLPKATGVPEIIRAVIQPISSRELNDPRGTVTEEMYRLSPRPNLSDIPMHSEIDWNGATWVVVTPGIRYGNSSRTAHTDYTIRRN